MVRARAMRKNEDGTLKRYRIELKLDGIGLEFYRTVSAVQAVWLAMKEPELQLAVASIEVARRSLVVIVYLPEDVSEATYFDIVSSRLRARVEAALEETEILLASARIPGDTPGLAEEDTRG